MIQPIRPYTFAFRLAALLATLTAVGGCGGGGGGGSPPPEPPQPANARPQIAAISDPERMTVGETLEIEVSVTDANASDTHTIDPTSNDEQVATVSADGLTIVIVADASGTATITVTATDSSGRTNAASSAVTFTVTVQSSSGWVDGLFEDDAMFKTLCAVPRTGAEPTSGDPYPDQQGTTLDENNWLRSWSNDTYLWYDEIEDVDPDCCDTPTYFGHMKTEATTASGAAKDQFHFTQDTAQWIARSQAGVSAGYGARFAVLAGRPPRDIRVAYTEPDSPATSAGVRLLRGTKILEVDGVDAINAPSRAAANVLNAGLFPSDVGQTHRFKVQDPGSEDVRAVTMRTAVITSDPVQHVRVIDTDTGPVGYLLFNDHNAVAEERLFDAMGELAEEGVEDLVLDLRYNGGGYLVIASQLAYMIAGSAAAQGRVFSELQFNGKHTEYDPVTGRRLAPSLFQATTVGLSVSPGEPLPAVDLERVFLLGGPSTCSASESIINGLRGIDVEVILMGGTTCGKPYGFYPEDNCGTTYFTVQFKAVNAKGFGDYADGFTPADDPREGATEVPGCAVADDFDHQFGDPEEARLAAALAYRTTSACPEDAAAEDAAAGPDRFLLAERLDADGRIPVSHGLMVPPGADASGSPR